MTMTRLTGRHFEKLYLGLFEVLPSQRKERPTPEMLKNLYYGVGGVAGFSRYSKEHFEELVGRAQQECAFMPTPAWFNQRSQELSAPGREETVYRPQLPAGQQALGDPDRIRAIFRAAEESAKSIDLRQKEKARSLVRQSGKGWAIDPDFDRWVVENVPFLVQRFPPIAQRAGRNPELLKHGLIHSPHVQLQYVKNSEGEEDVWSYWAEVEKHKSAIVPVT